MTCAIPCQPSSQHSTTKHHLAQTMYMPNTMETPNTMYTQSSITCMSTGRKAAHAQHAHHLPSVHCNQTLQLSMKIVTLEVDPLPDRHPRAHGAPHRLQTATSPSRGDDSAQHDVQTRLRLCCSVFDLLGMAQPSKLNALCFCVRDYLPQ